MISATYSAFRVVEHPEFVDMTGILIPGYVPPSRKEVADKYLPPIYEKEVGKCADGLSNVHNKPIVFATVTTCSGHVYLVDNVDTSGRLSRNHCHSINRKGPEGVWLPNCSVVTDNAANTAAMRMKLEENIANLLKYGCSAHILNLFAHDLEISNVKKHVVCVVKYH